MARLAAALIALAAFATGAIAEVPVPPLKARVTDLTGTLSASERETLEARLADFERRRGTQFAVLLVPTTKPEEIEQYAIRVAEAWKIGRKGVDDGLILLVAKDDRRVRIEVGYGLEGAIPDSVAKRVIEERIVPRFREGDFYGGLASGLEALIRLAEGERLPAPQPARERGASAFAVVEAIPVFLFFVVAAGAVLRVVLGRLAGALATGAGAGLIAWLIFGFAVALLAALVAFAIAYANTGAGRSGRWTYGGVPGGWGGGFGGGGFGGGFRGGGGGFGGGGASGRW
ncbi:MAG: YgcG family protein [Burkholderiales bacterium]|nr:YgcG family protein [Burkholderiales bacterium]